MSGRQQPPPIETVGDLLDSLRPYKRSQRVFMSSDAEGNSFAHVDTPAVESADDDTMPVIIWPRHEHLDGEGL